LFKNLITTKQLTNRKFKPMRIKQTRIYLFLTLMILFGMNQASWAQSFQVTGTVTDSQGLPIPGVNVIEKGTKKGVNTDLEGKFKINTSAKAVLEFSYIGFETKQVSVNGQSVINQKLNTSSTELTDVVVVAYGKQKKISVSGAISAISGEQLNRSPSVNIANTIAGQITGVSTVQATGRPGADNPQIFIRGVASLTEANSQPLLIVDGVERPFSNLDADEIETFSVLKDASATAVYGVRGANGVVIVTTKRGKIGKASIIANYSRGVQQATRLLDFSDSYTYATVYNRAQLSDNPTWTPSQLQFSPRAVEAFRTNSDPIIFPNTDWLDYILKPFADQSRANVSISGGNDSVRYFTSIGVVNQDGLFRTFDTGYNYNFSYQRFNFRTNLDIDVTKSTKIGLTIGSQVGITNEPRTNSGVNQLFREIYWSQPYSSPGIIDGKYVIGGTEYIPGNKVNALASYYGLGYNNTLRNTLNFDLDLTQQLNFIPGLSFRTKLSYNTNYSQTKTRASSKTRYTPFYLRDIDPTANQTVKELVYRTSSSEGNLSYAESFGKDRDSYFEAGLNYAKKFGSHNFGGLLLYNQQKDYYPRDADGNLTTNQDIPRGLVGMVGRITYDYNSKYSVDFNIGYNGSENFAEENRFGVFPAISGGWVVTKEKFMESVKFIDFLKFRYSYGIVGNDKIGGNRFLYLPDSFILSQGSYSFGTDNPTNQTAAAEGIIGNPDVTWETATKQNLAVEMKFLKNRLGIIVDVFKEDRTNILTRRGTVPDIVAFTLPAVNIGEVENKGYEVELNWNHKPNQNFSYRINANVSYSVNKIIFQDEIPQTQPYLYRTGNPVGQPFGYIFDRFYGVNEQPSDAPNHNYILKPGDMVYKDLDGDGVITLDDQKAIGFPNYPQYILGLNAGFEYKNFDFNMSWVGATNTSRMLAETLRTPFVGTERGLMQHMADDSWTPETANTAILPRVTFLGSQNNYGRDSDFWLRDASYVRLKTLETGYNFKGKYLAKAGMSTLRLYFNANNLLTFSKLDIIDPETRSGSIQEYPLTKLYNLGVRVNFL
jgi:TonB-linked SusC/RagA family outer membrane protein